MSCGVDLEELGSLLVVDGDEDCCGCEGAHGGGLGVDLGDVGDALGELGAGDGVAVFVLEVVGFVADSLDEGLQRGGGGR